MRLAKLHCSFLISFKMSIVLVHFSFSNSFFQSLKLLHQSDGIFTFSKMYI